MKRIVFLVVMLACASTVSINAERILSYNLNIESTGGDSYEDYHYHDGILIPLSRTDAELVPFLQQLEVGHTYWIDFSYTWSDPLIIYHDTLEVTYTCNYTPDTPQYDDMGGINYDIDYGTLSDGSGNGFFHIWGDGVYNEVDEENEQIIKPDGTANLEPFLLSLRFHYRIDYSGIDLQNCHIDIYDSIDDLSN